MECFSVRQELENVFTPQSERRRELVIIDIPAAKIREINSKGLLHVRQGTEAEFADEARGRFLPLKDEKRLNVSWKFEMLRIDSSCTKAVTWGLKYKSSSGVRDAPPERQPSSRE